MNLISPLTCPPVLAKSLSQVSRNEDGTLCSGLYRKATSGNTILHASSFFPQYSQYLRVRRNCTNYVFLAEAGNLRDRLLQRGYSCTSLKKAFTRATSHTRQKLIYSQKPQNQDNPLWIITKYCNQHAEVRKIVYKFWHVLTMDPNLGRLLPEIPLFTLRKAMSIASK